MADTIETKRDWRHHWSAVGQRVGQEDFFHQVERTIAGRAIDPLQIDLVVDAIRTELGLEPTDTLLDLCCGNGLVTIRLSHACQRIVGVDFSTELIEVARKHHSSDKITYLYGSATEVTPTQLGGIRPSKIVMCVGLQYFSEQNLGDLMRAIGGLTQNSVPIYFTDVPDVDHLYDFYDTPERRADYERRKAVGTEAMGTWWSARRLDEIMRSFGYSAEIQAQDPRRFGAHYRFDLLATPIDDKLG